jgi:hypothetical protein
MKSAAAQTDESEKVQAHRASSHGAATFDDWSLEDDLREAQWMVEALDPASATWPRRWDWVETGPRSATVLRRLDGVAQSRTSQRVRPRGHRPALGLVSWLMLSLSVIVLAVGGACSAWSALAGREAWRPGAVGLALAGQAALLVGFALLLQTLRQTRRGPSRSLREMDERPDPRHDWPARRMRRPRVLRRRGAVAKP